MNCPKCKSKEKCKAGNIYNKQRYKCKECGCQYTQSNKRGKPESLKLIAYAMYLEGMGFRGIGRLLGVSNVAVLKWVRSYAEKFDEVEVSKKPMKCSVIEIDEMWHYLGKKNEKSGFGLLLIGILDKSLDGKLGVVDKRP